MSDWTSYYAYGYNLTMRILLVLCFLAFSTPVLAETKPSALERIVSSREIRCGYNVYPPYLYKDVNTGQMSGIFYDIMAEIGKNAQLKIVWSEEAGLGDIFSGLDADRYDAWCSGLWPNATRALAGRFTTPAFYSVITPWVRADDARFKTLDDLRQNKARITAVDGAMEAVIAAVNFPELPLLTLPQLSSFDSNFQNILSGKADVTFASPAGVSEFLVAHPGSLRSLGASAALRTFANTLVVRRDDVETQEFLNIAMDEVVQSGAADRILKKYETVPGSFLRVAQPFAAEP